MCIELVMPPNHLILCSPLLLLPSNFPRIRVFSNESALRIRWPKYWSFSFSISPSNEHPGLISFRMDWLDLLTVQGTLKSLLQYHSSKASILRRSAFFTVQLSHPYMTTGKTIALTRRIVSPKLWILKYTLSSSQIVSLNSFPRLHSISSLALSLLYGLTLPSIRDYQKNHSFDSMDLCRPSDISVFNMLFRLVITFLPRSKHLLISWLQSPSTVIFEPPKIKSATVSS